MFVPYGCFSGQMLTKQLTLCLMWFHHNEKHHFNSKFIQDKGTGSLFKIENCCTVQFHFSLRLIVCLKWVEDHDQNCVSLCILICSPKILLYFQWSKMGYAARGCSFSVQPFFLRTTRIWNLPSHQTAIKEVKQSLSTFAGCCCISLGGVASSWHRIHHHTPHCNCSHPDISDCATTSA